jgi:hypothetical protein
MYQHTQNSVTPRWKAFTPSHSPTECRSYLCQICPRPNEKIFCACLPSPLPDGAGDCARCGHHVYGSPPRFPAGPHLRAAGVTSARSRGMARPPRLKLPKTDEPAEPCFTSKYLRARPLGEWLQTTGRQERLGLFSKHFSDRISKWISRGGRASEKTVDEMMTRLGEHYRAVPAEFWITESAPVTQLSVFGTTAELAELMEAA